MKNCFFKNLQINKVLPFKYILRDIFCFVFLGAFFAASFLLLSKNKSYTVSEKPETPENTALFAQSDEISEDVPYITDTRTLSEYRGYLAVFDCFGTLLKTYDIDVSDFPEKDRELLEEGIVFNSEKELLNFVENLES